MNKEDIKPIIVLILCVLLTIAYFIFRHLNENTGSQEYIIQGKIINKETSTVGGISQGGSTLELVYKYTFKLDSGEEIQLINQPFCANLTPGSRVNILWHKSLFFKEAIYDYCKPL